MDQKNTWHFLSKNFLFIDSIQFMNSSLGKLVKNLSDNDFKQLTKTFGSKNLQHLKQKGAYPEYMDSFKRFIEELLHNKEYFYRSVKHGITVENGGRLDSHISDEEYLTCKKFAKKLA